MSFLDTVKHNITSMSYAWNSPATYVVFVPGLSLLIQKIQMATMLPLRLNPVIPNLQNIPDSTVVHRADQEGRRFMAICKWHFRGPLIQTLAFLTIKTQKLALFKFVWAIFIAYELINTVFKACKTSVIVYEFDQSGKVIRYTMQSALSV